MKAIRNGQENPVVRAGAFFSALLMLTVPFSTAVSLVVSILVIMCWLLSCQYRGLSTLVRQNSIVASALALYGLFLLGTLYGDATMSEAISMLRKYRELLLLVILMPFMEEEKYRRWVLTALIAASVVTLLSSYLKDMEILPLSRQDTPTFKSRITHNVFMSFFAYYCVYRSSLAKGRRWIWLTGFALAAVNVLFIVQGRTGQVIFLLLMSLFFFQRFHFKRAVILTPLFLIAFVGLLNISGGAERIQEGIENSRDYLQGQRNLQTSMGQRLYFWQNSIGLIAQRPVFGYGTGSFAEQFSRITGGKNLLTENPHNEYLMISVQLGGLGLFVYLLFLGFQWRYSFQLPEDRRWFAQGVSVSLAINSLLNTTFLDYAEGHWYACLIALSFAGFAQCGPKASEIDLPGITEK